MGNRISALGAGDDCDERRSNIDGTEEFDRRVVIENGDD